MKFNTLGPFMGIKNFNFSKYCLTILTQLCSNEVIKDYGKKKVNDWHHKILVHVLSLRKGMIAMTL